MKYIVIEIQVNADNTTGLLPYAFDGGDVPPQSAEAKYHQILSEAAESQILNHGAVMLTGKGEFVKSECYEHPAE